MEAQGFLIIGAVILVAFSLGLYSLLSGMKGWYKKHESKKATGKMIRSILGEKTFGGFLKFIGISLMILSIAFGVFIMNLSSGSSKSKKPKKTSEIVATYMHPQSGEVTLSTDKQKIAQKVGYFGDEELVKYITISFENNYIDEIPDFVWKMKNLETIDLTNNKIENLPIEKIKSLEKLKKIVLSNNPILESEISKLRNALEIEIIF